MTQPTCETCRFWVPYNLPKRYVEGTGDCRARAPVAKQYHPGGYEDTVDTQTSWATTNDVDFCGEHKSKEKADE